MNSIYVRMGDALVQFSISTPLFEKQSPIVFGELPDTDANLRKAASMLVMYAFAQAIGDQAMLGKIPESQLIAAIMVLVRGKERRWPGGELILKPEIAQGPSLGRGVMFEAGPYVDEPSSINEWRLGAGPDVVRSVNIVRASLDITRPN